ncbi:MAG: hypothetical protein JXA71_19000 [Chitinispirillaceae bacterium]|nr:hypothetical protein [Chitinispirillaceae bacterium]
MAVIIFGRKFRRLNSSACRRLFLFRRNYFSAMAPFPSFILRVLAGSVAALCLFSNTAVAAAAFNLQGRVPSSITHAFLASGYGRILAAVAPDMTADTIPITIIYYGKNDERTLGVRLPEWGGGGAIGRDTIIVPLDNAPLADMAIDRVTLHELVHIALERRYGRLRLPRWFHEGVAMTLSGELSFEEQTVLSRAVITRRLLPLDSIEKVNRFDAYGAALAYSQSHLAVLFIIESWGMDAIPELLAAVRKTGTFDSALTAVFGLTGGEFERLAHDFIADRYRYLFLIGDTWLYWLPAALLVVVGFVMVRIRNRKRQAQMEREDAVFFAPVPEEGNGSGCNHCEEEPEIELCEDGTEPDDDDGDDESGDPRR